VSRVIRSILANSIRELRAAQKERRRLEAEQAEEDAYNPPLEDTLAFRSGIAANAQTNPTPSSQEEPQEEPEFQERTNKAKLFEIGIGCVSKSSNTDTTISKTAQAESQECTNSGS